MYLSQNSNSEAHPRTARCQVGEVENDRRKYIIDHANAIPGPQATPADCCSNSRNKYRCPEYENRVKSYARPWTCCINAVSE